MATALRFLVAILVASLVTIVLLIAVELFSAVVHPVPPGFENTMEAMCQHVARYPHWVLAVAAGMWSAIGFVGSWLAGRVGGRGSGLVMAVLLIAALVWNVLMLPYYLWFKVVALTVIPAATLAGAWLAGGRAVPAPTPA